MSDSKGSGDKTISVGKKTLSLSKNVDAGSVRQNFSHGRSKSVVVEKKRKRMVAPKDEAVAEKNEAPVKVVAPEPKPAPVVEKPAPKVAAKKPSRAPAKKGGSKSGVVLRSLSDEEKAKRAQALTQARAVEAEARKQAEIDAVKQAEEDARLSKERAEAEARQAEEDGRRKEEDAARKKSEEETSKREEAARITDAEAAAQKATSEKPVKKEPAATAKPKIARPDDAKKGKTAQPAKPTPSRKGPDERRRGKLTLSSALRGDNERQRSMASIKRRRQKEKMAARGPQQPQEKQVREVVVPETITVAELAIRMAERGAAVVKQLMGMGVMATINQSIDADTAELLIAEFGHKIKRVSDSDVELGIRGSDDDEGDLASRAPVVTIMGHVDHGKTSLLDALRRTDVAAGEAGGITQHIGAYQIIMQSGDRITFLDTPGHEAFTAMRARGASVTDVVVLVVAADDGVMPQTVEAINHAKAAEVPIIIAINKMDKPEADPTRVKNELLQHELVVEEMGGDILTVEVSAKTGAGLEKLEETILLQSELLELKANPDRRADGIVVEAKLDKGRGPVATVLVQRGTLKQGDIFVAGSEWGRVRALINDRNEQVTEAGPSLPIEVLGSNGTPEAGEEFAVVENEARAREISEYRQRIKREKSSAGAVKGATLDQMLVSLKEKESKIEFPILIKGDVQGSVEAIIGSLEKLGNDEISVRVIHNAVGGITESDVTFAQASQAPIIAFNVRANRHARDQAERDGVEIRYYSVIYDLVDDVKKAMAGLLSPEIRETFLGYADIREVFHISKVGKVAGCLVTEGIVRRGSKVRLLRDDVVIHEGTLSTLKRHKNEVKEVTSGTECGMAFENYQDLQAGDVIECFDAEEIARTL